MEDINKTREQLKKATTKLKPEIDYLGLAYDSAGLINFNIETIVKILHGVKDSFIDDYSDKALQRQINSYKKELNVFNTNIKNIKNIKEEDKDITCFIWEKISNVLNNVAEFEDLVKGIPPFDNHSQKDDIDSLSIF